MAAGKGRSFQVKKSGTVIAGVKNKGVTVNNEPVDITSDDDSGFRTLLADTAVSSMDISVDGVTKDTTLRTVIMAGGTSVYLTDITLEYPNGDTITGDFYLASLEESGETKDAVNFSASLQSSGQFTYTAA